MVKVLVADQHPIVCKGLEHVFNGHTKIKIQGSVNDGEDIFTFLNKNSIDIVLTEIDLPKLNGITAIRKILSDFKKVKVLVFSAQSEAVYGLSSIRAGAQGYLSKSASIETIVDAILTVSNNNIYLSDALLKHLNKNAKELTSDSYYKKLSTREVEVLKLLVSGKRNKDIATELNINEKTVSTYKVRLMKKLNVDNLLDLVNVFKIIEL